MANKNYTQYILLAAIAVFIVVGIANYGSPSGYSVEGPDRYDVTTYVCDWGDGSRDPATGMRPGGGWHWIGETSTSTWALGAFLTRTEAYCNQGTWTCTNPATGKSIIGPGGSAECGANTDGSVCFCRR